MISMKNPVDLALMFQAYADGVLCAHPSNAHGDADWLRRRLVAAESLAGILTALGVPAHIGVCPACGRIVADGEGEHPDGRRGRCTGAPTMAERLAGAMHRAERARIDTPWRSEAASPSDDARQFLRDLLDEQGADSAAVRMSTSDVVGSWDEVTELIERSHLGVPSYADGEFVFAVLPRAKVSADN